MMDPLTNRRRARRLPIHADALVMILLPEMTFAPRGIRGVAVDISAVGLQVRTYQLDYELADILRRSVHHAKVTLELPYITSLLTLRTRVVRIEAFPGRRKGEDSYFCMGMEFEELPDQVQAQIDYVISRLSGDSVETVALPRDSRPDSRTSQITGIPLPKRESKEAPKREP